MKVRPGAKDTTPKTVVSHDVSVEMDFEESIDKIVSINAIIEETVTKKSKTNSERVKQINSDHFINNSSK